MSNSRYSNNNGGGNQRYSSDNNNNDNNGGGNNNSSGGNSNNRSSGSSSRRNNSGGGNGGGGGAKGDAKFVNIGGIFEKNGRTYFQGNHWKGDLVFIDGETGEQFLINFAGLYAPGDKAPPSKMNDLVINLNSDGVERLKR